MAVAITRMSARWLAVQGAPRPAESYCQRPTPGCQNARRYGVDAFPKA